MRDYYAEYLTKNNENMSESKMPKVPKGVTEGENQTFGTFGTEHFGENPENFCLEKLLENPELKTQFEFEIEERAAIIAVEQILTEAEACWLARENVIETWRGLFEK